MFPFQYSRAATVQDAIRQKSANSEVRFLAGGTNIIDLMKYNVERPVQLGGVLLVAGAAVVALQLAGEPLDIGLEAVPGLLVAFVRHQHFSLVPKNLIITRSLLEPIDHQETRKYR